MVVIVWGIISSVARSDNCYSVTWLIFSSANG